MLTRFAPSPTGHLHLGHVLAAKQAFGFGPCLLRIENIDHTRCKREFIEAIFEILGWLGFSWPETERVQNQHYHDYFGVLRDLLDRDLAYPCNLTRSDIKNGQTPNPCSMTAADWGTFAAAQSSLSVTKPSLPFAIRLNLEAALDELSGRSLIFSDETPEKGPVQRNAAKELRTWRLSENRPDPIIGRKDIGVSYHIAVTHDDALQNITHIVRGMDLFEDTSLHVLIQALMDWPTPIYHHHALMLRPDGKKLSKREADISILSLREKGLTARQVLDMAEP